MCLAADNAVLYNSDGVFKCCWHQGLASVRVAGCWGWGVGFRQLMLLSWKHLSLGQERPKHSLGCIQNFLWIGPIPASDRAWRCLQSPKDEQKENWSGFTVAFPFTSSRLRINKTMTSIVTSWVIYMHLSTLWRNQAKRKDEFGLLMLAKCSICSSKFNIWYALDERILY